jgi:hypothetical protein
MNKYLSFLAFTSVIFFSCNESAPSTAEEVIVEEVVEIIMEKDGITLSTNQHETQFTDAHIHLLAPENTAQDTVAQTFRFEIENYELGLNTADILSGQCANSGKGQHIHYIMNNSPYKAYYEAEFEEKIPAGHNVMLSFLSRSYHMSLKEYSAYVLKEFNTDGSDDNFDETQAHMFYSRPKGAYVGNDATKVMLDFFLINTNLEDKGYSVKATINGVSFDLKIWRPYFIEGLVEGDNTIMLEMLDADGQLVPSPFNPVERIINVKYSEESI